jgi:SPW repeat
MATQYGGGYYAWHGRYNRWQDWANVILAIWLFISPWVLQFGAGTQVAPAGAVNGPAVAVSHAAWNAWVLGVIVFLVALSAIGSWEVGRNGGIWCSERGSSRRPGRSGLLDSHALAGIIGSPVRRSFYSPSGSYTGCAMHRQ